MPKLFLRIVIITQFIFVCCEAQHDKKIKSILQGTWICLQDSSYSVQIKNDTILEKYLDNVEEERIFIFSVSKYNCGFRLKKRKAWYLKKIDIIDKTEFCYLISDLSDSNFTIIYEGGKVIDFVRKD